MTIPDVVATNPYAVGQDTYSTSEDTPDHTGEAEKSTFIENSSDIPERKRTLPGKS